MVKNVLIALILFLFVGGPSLVYAETKIFFSPNGGCQEAIIAEINKAHKSVDIAMYALTSKEIASALVMAKGRHVRVRVSLDMAQVKDYFSKSRYLINKGINVKFHMGPGLLHDKFAVIDGHEVITGSFNWTMTAEKKNFENLLIIKDKETALTYTKQFRHLWARSGQGQIKVLRQEELN